MVHRGKNRPYVLFLFHMFLSGSITILSSWGKCHERFLRRLFWSETSQGVVRPYLSNFCHIGFGITLTQCGFYGLLPWASTLLLYPSSPFYLNADISNLLFSTATARCFFMLRLLFVCSWRHQGPYYLRRQGH